MSHHEILVQHMVDIHRAPAEFREAPERKPATSSHMNNSSKHFAQLEPWNLTGEKKMPLNNKLQEGGISLPCKRASDYVDRDILTGRFHVTHYTGCAILFNKDTFYANVGVQSHLHS